MNTIAQLQDNVGRVIRGKRAEIERVVATLLAGGHLLLEDLPGVGKTMLARALARSLDADFNRVQCTPDLMPSDITGVSIFHPKDQTFEFQKGPVFTHVLLADEINRATPRTQSALLEAMEERQVTADGETHALPAPFFMIATQNPIELAGTFPLPEAQLDRFLMMLTLGHPSNAVEVEILTAQEKGHPLEQLQPCMRLEDLRAAQNTVRQQYIDPSLLDYIQRIVARTRAHESVTHGSSTRGALGLMQASKALSVCRGERYVTPDGIQELAPWVLGHRLVVEPRARVQGTTGPHVIQQIVPTVEVPISYAPA